MKITVVHKKELNAISFPKLMSSRVGKQIVLFNESQKGTVLSSDCRQYGYYSDCWNMDEFKDFEGRITLENSEL